MKNWKTYYDKINLIYNGLIISTLLPFAILFFDLFKNKLWATNIPSFPLSILYVSVIILEIYIFYEIKIKLKNKFQVQIKNGEIKEKLNYIYKFQLSKFIFLEIGSLVALLGLFFTSHIFFIAVYLINLLQFSISIPSYYYVEKNIKITKEDQEKLLKNENL